MEPETRLDEAPELTLLLNMYRYNFKEKKKHNSEQFLIVPVYIYFTTTFNSCKIKGKYTLNIVVCMLTFKEFIFVFFILHVYTTSLGNHMLLRRTLYFKHVTF
jgi:hypothetical protein